MSNYLKLKRGHDDSDEEYAIDDTDSVVTSGEEDYTDDESFSGETTEEESDIEVYGTSPEEEADSDYTSDEERLSSDSRNISQVVANNKTVENKSKVENIQIIEHNDQVETKRETNDIQPINDQQTVEETEIASSLPVVTEEITYTETVSQPISVEDTTQKRIQEHREYRRKLEEDPSFVPYVGLFWGHDDRYREDALTETRSPGSQTEPRFSSTSSSSKNQRATEYQRQLDPLMYKKWDHSGWEEILQLEEQEERQKRELIESGQRDPNAEHKPSQYYHHNNRQNYPSRGRGRAGYHQNHHQDQKQPRMKSHQNRGDSTPREEWPDLNQNTHAKKEGSDQDTFVNSATWQNTTNAANNWGTNDDTTPSTSSKTGDTGMVNAWGSVDRVREIHSIVDNDKPTETSITDGWGVPSSTATNIDSYEGWEPSTIAESDTNISGPSQSLLNTENDWSNSVNVDDSNRLDQNGSKTAIVNGWGKPTKASKDNRNNTTTIANNEWGTTSTSTNNGCDHTTTSTNNDWNNTTNTTNSGLDHATTTTKSDWNNTTHTKSQTQLDAVSNHGDTRKSGWNRSSLKKDDHKVISEDIPIEERASSSWANAIPVVEVPTTPSSWTRRKYNNDRHSGKGNYTKNNSYNNDNTSSWKASNHPCKITSPCVTTEELTQDWNKKPASDSATWNTTPAVANVANEATGWNEQAITSPSKEPSGRDKTSTVDINNESSGWGHSSKDNLDWEGSSNAKMHTPSHPSMTDTSSWTEQSKTIASINTTTITANTTQIESSTTMAITPISSTPSQPAATPPSSSAASSSWIETQDPTETTPTTIPVSSTTYTSSGWGEPNIDVTVTDATNGTKSISAENPSSWSEPVQSSGWNTKFSENTSDWNIPNKTPTVKAVNTHGWADSNLNASSSRDTTVTKDSGSSWSTPIERSGYEASVHKEFTAAECGNNRSSNSSNWNSDREANNKLKLTEPLPRKGRGYLSQKMESSPSPTTIVTDQHETLEKTTETTTGSAWERFHQQGDSDSDVEIILEAEEEPEWIKQEQVLGMTAPNDGAVRFQETHASVTLVPPSSSMLHIQAESPVASNENSPRTEHVYRQYDNSSPRPESSRKYSSSSNYNSNKNLRKPRRNFDDNWRQRNDHQQQQPREEQQQQQQQLQYNSNGPPMYYPTPINGANITYVPMIPNANGNPMYGMPFPMGGSPTVQSVSPHHHNEDNSRSSSPPQQLYPSPSTLGPNGAIQLPPGYEANGMVYYGMDPSALYPTQPFYYYTAPMPMGAGNTTNGAIPFPPSRQQQEQQQQQMVYHHPAPEEDIQHHKLNGSSPQPHILLEEDDGWGPSPSIQDGEAGWSNNKNSSPLMDKSNSRYNSSNSSSPYYFYQ